MFRESYRQYLARMDSYSYSGYDFEEGSGVGKQVVVGVCAMEKKTLSKPMKEILTRLEEFEYIKTFIFSEKVILDDPVEKWPIVDCLIAFHSKVTDIFPSFLQPFSRPGLPPGEVHPIRVPQKSPCHQQP